MAEKQASSSEPPSAAKLREDAERKAKAEKEAAEKLEALQKKYPLSMGLEACKPKYTPKKAAPFKGSMFSAITASEVKNGQRCFVALYEMYERRPFLEPLENQETLENVTAEITFGISDDAFRCDVTVAPEDRWLVPQNQVDVTYEEGFCEVSLTPTENQYGEADIFVEVEDVGGVSKHDFTLKIVKDVSKDEKKDGKKRGRRRGRGLVPRGAGSSGESKSEVDILDEDFDERSDNPAYWTNTHVVDWLLEVGLSKFAKSFASKEVDGKLLLSLSAEVLRDQYGVTKPRDRTKFVKLVERLNEESEIAAHAERELKKDEIEREKLRIAKEERRAKARGEKGGGGGKNGDDDDAFNDGAEGGVDPWLCGHAPRITRGECGRVDLDAFALAVELQKIERLDHGVFRDRTLIDFTASDARLVLTAAMTCSFLRVVGLEADEARYTTGKQFIQRYNSRYRKTFPKDKRSQRIAILQQSPSEYEFIADASVVIIRWPQMEDTFYKRHNRFYVWTDLISVLGKLRRASFLIVMDDADFSPADEKDPKFRSMQARPGNGLQGFILRRTTPHRFSWGKQIVYTYEKREEFSNGELEFMEAMRTEDEEDQKQIADMLLLAEESTI